MGSSFDWFGSQIDLGTLQTGWVLLVCPPNVTHHLTGLVNGPLVGQLFPRPVDAFESNEWFVSNVAITAVCATAVCLGLAFGYTLQKSTGRIERPDDTDDFGCEPSLFGVVSIVKGKFAFLCEVTERTIANVAVDKGTAPR